MMMTIVMMGYGYDVALHGMGWEAWGAIFWDNGRAFYDWCYGYLALK